MSMQISDVTECMLKMCPELSYYRSTGILHPRKSPLGGVVYLIAFNKRGPVKIGHTTMPKHRFEAIELAAGRKLTSIYLSRPHKNHYEFEQHMHTVLSDYRGVGEWFNISVSRAVDEIEKQMHVMELLVEYDVSNRHMWKNYIF